MNFKLLVILLIIFSNVFSATQKPRSFMNFKIKKFSCKFDKSVIDLVYPNFTCYAKSYSRIFSSIYAYMHLQEPLKKFYVRHFDFLKLNYFLCAIFLTIKIRGVLSYKYGTITREVIRGPRLEYCAMVASKSTAPFIVKTFINMIEKSGNFTFFECPIKVRILNP